jgi:hypothetical protein
MRVKSYIEEREQADSMFHPTDEIEETYLLKSESQIKKKPLHLTGHKTTLTRYLELDSWTPEEAACLVAGIKPETLIPFGSIYSAWSLSGLWLMGKGVYLLDEKWKCGYQLDMEEMCGLGCEAFSQRKRVLELWNSREESPPKIKPSDFIAWCIPKNIDTTWLAEIGTHPSQNAPATNVETAPVTTPAPVNTTNKTRRDILDPAIDKAIQQADNMESAEVYLKLKELALAGELPFTGVIDGIALCYTNANDKQAKLTKAALGQRLKRRRL